MSGSATVAPATPSLEARSIRAARSKHTPRDSAPRCPVHLCVEMRLSSGWRPSFVSVGAVAAIERARKRVRTFWRCPVAGCARVAAAASKEPDEAE